MSQFIGILTSGGDGPGLNAAIRGVGKAGMDHFDMEVIGSFLDSFGQVGRNLFGRLTNELSCPLTITWCRRENRWHFIA